MKKLIYILLISISIMSCQSKSAKAQELKEKQVEVVNTPLEFDKTQIRVIDDKFSIMYNITTIADIPDIRYELIVDGVKTKIYTYHTSHHSEEELLEFLMYSYEKSNIEPFKYK